MDAAVRAWLVSQLGATTDPVDLEQRYARLGNARRTALEVLYERKAALVYDQPVSVNVSSVVSVGYAENIKAIERQITLLESGDPSAPDEPDPGDDGGQAPVGFIQLIERRRR
ncbi:hypothetical protein ACIPW9_36140 [Streptomyces sp. NPDC090052]|uniref:hypothetical protein n=1 Tax=Streptomyces sp. NPDC090052 TaxID=3365931 RepID=UPI003807BE3A